MAPMPKKKVKNVIYLLTWWGPSHLDLWDNKPMLRKMYGENASSFLEGRRFAFLRGHPTVMGAQFEFERHGKKRMELSSLWKHCQKWLTTSP